MTIFTSCANVQNATDPKQSRPCGRNNYLAAASAITHQYHPSKFRSGMMPEFSPSKRMTKMEPTGVVLSAASRITGKILVR